MERDGSLLHQISCWHQELLAAIRHRCPPKEAEKNISQKGSQLIHKHTSTSSCLLSAEPRSIIQIDRIYIGDQVQKKQLKHTQTTFAHPAFQQTI